MIQSRYVVMLIVASLFVHARDQFHLYYDHFLRFVYLTLTSQSFPACCSRGIITASTQFVCICICQFNYIAIFFASATASATPLIRCLRLSCLFCDYWENSGYYDASAFLCCSFVMRCLHLSCLFCDYWGNSGYYDASGFGLIVYYGG